MSFAQKEHKREPKKQIDWLYLPALPFSSHGKLNLLLKISEPLFSCGVKSGWKITYFTEFLRVKEAESHHVGRV